MPNKSMETSFSTTFGSSSHHRASPPPPPSPTENEDSMSLVIVKVCSGCDIVKSILDVGRRCKTSLAVQSASGTVASVTLRDMPPGAPNFRVHGPFNLLCLTGSYFHDNQYTLLPGATPPPDSPFGIHLATSDGRVFGGHIGGRVIACGEVNLTIFTFKNPKIDKYYSEEEENDEEGDEEGDDTHN